MLTGVLFRVLLPERLERLRDRNMRAPELFVNLLDLKQPYATEIHGQSCLPPMSLADVRESADKLYEILLHPWITLAKI